MNRMFRISNKVSGAELGIYVAETADEALEAMAREAGYESYQDVCQVTGTDETQLIISEVDGSDIDPLDSAMELLIEQHELSEMGGIPDESPDEHCPECGGDDLEIVESQEFMRGKVLQCLDCFHVIRDA